MLPANDRVHALATGEGDVFNLPHFRSMVASLTPQGRPNKVIENHVSHASAALGLASTLVTGGAVIGFILGFATSARLDA